MVAIAAILGIVLLLSMVVALAYREDARFIEAESKEVLEAYSRLLAINADLQQELIRTGAHRDELLARYHDQEVDREIKEANAKKRSEHGRKMARARWARREA